MQIDNGPAASARAFLDAYAAGDREAMLALCTVDARAEYVPWGEEGLNPVLRAVDFWTRCPAAFEAFAVSITEVFEDVERRTAIFATINRGTQRADVDGIANTSGQMACPLLFITTLGDNCLIARVQVWCDQVTLYRQLGYLAGFSMGRAA